MSTYLTIPVDVNGNITSDAAVEGIARALERMGWTPGGGGGVPSVLSGPGRPDKPETTLGAIIGDEPLGATYTCTDATPPEGLRVSRKVADGVWHPVEGKAVWAAAASSVATAAPGEAFKDAPGATGAIMATITPTSVLVTAQAVLAEELPSGTAISVKVNGSPGLSMLATSTPGQATIYAPEHGNHPTTITAQLSGSGTSANISPLGVPASTVVATATFATTPAPWPLTLPALG